jgi:hypothetical protein
MRSGGNLHAWRCAWRTGRNSGSGERFAVARYSLNQEFEEDDDEKCLNMR